ncbi:MAG: hypothetical protein H7833_10970 [Magnetococcus sp. DMHC-1]|nr:hypothetical protein [Magnetococcales bacterium]
MNVKLNGLKSDMQQVDAHIITPEEYEEIPELPPEFFTEGTLYRHGEPINRGKIASHVIVPSSRVSLQTHP